MSLKDDIRRKLGKPTGEKLVGAVQKERESKPVGLKPPPLPQIDWDLEDIDYEKIARSSELRRFIYYLYTGKVHRGSLERLDTELKIHREATSIINKLQRGSRQDFKECMKELEEKLQERREKSE